MQMGQFMRRPCSGLSLIEVLIALAIVSIALAAVIKTTSQNIQATSYLQDKTMATWVGQYILNEVRVGVLTLPVDDELKQSMQWLGKEWYFEAKAEQTANRRIQKITVDVFAHEKNSEELPLMSLESYTYGKE